MTVMLPEQYSAAKSICISMMKKPGINTVHAFRGSRKKSIKAAMLIAQLNMTSLKQIITFSILRKLKWGECERCKKYTDCYENPREYGLDAFFKFQLNEEYYSEFQYLCPDCKYALYAEERKFLNELAKKRAAETQAKREQEWQVEEWKERKRKRKRRKIILIVLAVFVGLPLLREAGIKISQAIKVSVEEKSVTKTKQEPKKK